MLLLTVGHRQRAAADGVTLWASPAYARLIKYLQQTGQRLRNNVRKIAADE